MSELKKQIISVSKIWVAFEWTFGAVGRIVQIKIDFFHIDLFHYLMSICQFYVIFNRVWKQEIHTFLFFLFDQIGFDSKATEGLKDEHDHIVPKCKDIYFWKKGMIAIEYHAVFSLLIQIDFLYLFLRLCESEDAGHAFCLCFFKIFMDFHIAVNLKVYIRSSCLISFKVLVRSIPEKFIEREVESSRDVSIFGQGQSEHKIHL